MSILLLSTGGGGGNILRSLKTLFARDVAIAQKTDAAYAERLRRAITTRFLDTNEFSLAQVPAEERLLIGAVTTRGLGAQHDPALAARALEESHDQIVELVANYSIVVMIGTGGKGTGAGTMFPLAEIVRRQNKLVLPVFVRPSFERHEVDKRRYDHALHVAAQFDHARIRLIEILNDRGYSDRDPQSQEIVWERMNRASVQRVVTRIRNISERACGDLGLDSRVRQIRPVALDAHERCSGQFGERTVRVLPAGVDRLTNLGLGRIVSLRRIDFAEADAHAAIAGEQDRQIRRIDLGQIPQHVDEPAQSPRNRHVHPFPHH